MLKLVILIIYFAVLIGIGLYCRKHATDVNGFVLGGRSVGPWLTAFAYGTSYFSAVVFVGYAGQFGWKYGIAATWAGIGNAIIGSLLAWVVLGRRTRIMSQHLDSATMPVFWKEIRQQSIKNRCFCYNIHFSNSIHSFTLQWTFKTFRYGFQH